MLSAELLELARRLRRRVEQSHPSAWRIPAGAGASRGDPPSQRALRLEDISREIRECRSCPLAAGRGRAVAGAGCAEAGVMFVGEGPGFEEDRRGEPFVGRAGELLDRILASIGLCRGAVYITNVVKCRPMKDPGMPDARGNDRPPSPQEAAACRIFLDRQIRAVSPRVIVALGAVAARSLLGTEEPIGRLRGRWREYRDGDLTAAVLPTFHPAALLRDPRLKKEVWMDMKALRARLGGAAG